MFSADLLPNECDYGSIAFNCEPRLAMLAKSNCCNFGKRDTVGAAIAVGDSDWGWNQGPEWAKFLASSALAACHVSRTQTVRIREELLVEWFAEPTGGVAYLISGGAS